MNKTICALVTALALNLGGCSDRCKESTQKVEGYYNLDRIFFEQILSTEDGIKIFYKDVMGEYVHRRFFDDGENSPVQYNNVPFPNIHEIDEFKGLRWGGNHIKIFQDLSSGSLPYADVVTYPVSALKIKSCQDVKASYVEVHLPKGSQLISDICRHQEVK